MENHVPDAGDIVWFNLNPQAGLEQAGHRSVVVLSPASYNARTSLMLCCPMTTKIKGYPFEVAITGKIQSVVLADQVKSLDWLVHEAESKGRITAAELSEIRRKALLLIGKP